MNGEYIFNLEITDELGNTANDEVSVIVLSENSSIWLEAECAEVGSGWNIVSDNDVSEEQYLSATSANNYYSTAPTDSNEWITFNFSAEAGNYSMFALINTPNDSDDSFWVRANGGNWINWNGLLRTGFSWRQLHDSDANEDLVDMVLLDGNNTIDIAIRENGTAVDKIYLTTTNNSPTGLGLQANNCEVTDTLPEAEAGDNVLLTLPDDTTTLTGLGNDPDGGLVTYLWTQLSGPENATLSGETTSALTVGTLIEGTYVFDFAVSDEEGNTTNDQVSIVVEAAFVDTNIWLEAECAVIGSGWSIVSDEDVSEGEYVNATSGSNFYSSAPTNTESYVSFNFSANEGIYFFYALINTPNTNNDSFWVRANRGSWIKWNDLLQQGFTWRQLHDSDSNSALVSFNLTEGENTLDIAIRENGASIDKIYLTETQTSPTGLGISGTNCGPIDAEPIANAGQDITVTLPILSTLISGNGTDPDGGEVTYLWSQISGPNIASLSNTTEANLTVDNLIEGEYTFSLEIKDEFDVTVSDEMSLSVIASGDIWLEAECAVVGSQWTIIDDSNVAGNQYISASSSENYFSNAPNDDSLISSIIFDAKAGNYDLYARASTLSTDNDSFWFRLNNGDWFNWNNINPNSTSFIWNKLNDDQSNSVVSLALIEGTNTIDFAIRESGAALDKIYLTNNGGLPSGFGNISTNCGPIDIIPLADAGDAVKLTLPNNSTTIKGSGYDPDGGSVTYSWMINSAPLGGSFTGTDTPTLTMENLIEGVYHLNLNVTDDENNVVIDDVYVIVSSTLENITPLVNAGEDVNVSSPVQSVILEGNGSDPDGGEIVYSWSQTSGPDGVLLTGSDTANLTLDNLIEGTYVFQLDIIDDEGDLSFDEVNVLVGAFTSNEDLLPYVNAGSDIIIDPLSFTSTTITGIGNDPDGGDVTFQWLQIEGTTTSINGASNTANLEISNLEEGEYIYSLSITDNEGNTVTDYINVSVQLSNDIWLEAECANIGYLWNQITDENVSNGKYVVAPDGENFQEAPENEYSRISFNFTAAEGTYNLFALVDAPTGANDSFYVRVNNGTWINWNGFSNINGFTWNQLRNSNEAEAFVKINLETGYNTVEFAHRESGVALDKIYLTKSNNIPNGQGGKDFTCTSPIIKAYFNETSNILESYGGSVQISLEALENRGSGAIERLDYVLNNSALTTYTDSFTVNSQGANHLTVFAENSNGNISQREFEFIIIPLSGAEIQIENMTKVPGTDRGFPANDYYSFHRTENAGDTKVHDTNTMRLNNTGTANLIITELNLSNSNRFRYQIIDDQGTVIQLPITITPGSYSDVTITFTANNPTKELFKESIEIKSNADNAIISTATLHGAFMVQPDSTEEIDAQQILDVFGFQTSMLSVVNDEGTITPPNPVPYQPSSTFPLANNVNEGYEGDLVLANSFVQADPNKPVIAMQIAAFHGGPVGHGANFQALDNEDRVGGINYFHNAEWYQTILPQRSNIISADQATTIDEPFEIVIQRYPSTGGNNFAGDRPDVLGTRLYKVIDHNGNVIPNEYIGIQDFVGGGCNGNGSNNCDFQDNVHYFINIRPSELPVGNTIDELVKSTNESFQIDLNSYFDIGYPGNSLNYSATTNTGTNLPNWMGINAITGEFHGTTLNNAGFYTVLFNATDSNGFIANTSLDIRVLEDGTIVTSKTITQTKQSNSLLLYPNPASVSTTLGFEMQTHIETIQIFDITGKLIKTIAGGLVDKYGTPIDIKELSTGIYYVKTKDTLGNVYEQKMLIERN